MSTLKFTDEQLERYVSDDTGDTSILECRLAQCIIDDRAALRQLIQNIEPMAKQVMWPADNVFSKQLSLIQERL